jgi:hypothetical protein
MTLPEPPVVALVVPVVVSPVVEVDALSEPLPLVASLSVPASAVEPVVDPPVVAVVVVVDALSVPSVPASSPEQDASANTRATRGRSVHRIGGP